MEERNNGILLMRTAGWLTGLILFIVPVHAAAHGVDISTSPVKGIEIIAHYDSGQPMAGGQVTIYAPDEPLAPWLTGICDDEGKYFFVPDYSRPGLWEVQVRLAGHGDLIRVEVTAAEETIADGSGGLSLLQKIVMTLVVAWGAVGTALYFSRRKS